jgi:hypothetical protein
MMNFQQVDDEDTDFTDSHRWQKYVVVFSVARGELRVANCEPATCKPGAASTTFAFCPLPSLSLPTSPFLPVIDRLGTDDPIGLLLLEAVGDPPGDPTDGEGGREEIRFHPQPMQEERRVELDVGLKVAARLVLL